MKKFFMAIVLCLVCTVSFGQFSYQQKVEVKEVKQKVWSYNTEYLEYFPEREMYCYSLYGTIKHYNDDWNRIENYNYNPISGKFEWKYKIDIYCTFYFVQIHIEIFDNFHKGRKNFAY
jgi:hypothetical protein